MNSLAGKRCLITGGSRGIGLGIAKLFANEDALCTLVGRNQDNLETAKSSLSNSSQHKVKAFDVSNIQKWEQFAAEHKKVPFDVLVNAAGVTQDSFLFNTDYVAIQEILDVNLKGTTFACRAMIPGMMRQKNGCIINISSLLATHSGRGASVYAASKAGIIGLTRSLAWEVGRFGIRANVILPGYIETDMIKGRNNNGELSALIPMGRLGSVDEVADAAAFLVKNSYAHNCVLNLDGGLSAT